MHFLKLFEELYRTYELIDENVAKVILMPLVLVNKVQTFSETKRMTHL